MKSIFYIRILVMISLFSFSVATAKSIQVITLQCTTEAASQEALDQSATIIKRRLEAMHLKPVKVRVDNKTKSLEIELGREIPMNFIDDLLIGKGTTDFFETYARRNVLPGIDNDSPLRDLLNIPGMDKQTVFGSNVLGTCADSMRPRVDKFLREHYVRNESESIRFAWSAKPGPDGNYGLYMLKQAPAMDASDIAQSEVDLSAGSGEPRLMIRFNNPGTAKWAELTGSQIGKSVAIVLNNRVYSAPVVQNKIKGGVCMITGNFSIEEIEELDALLSHGKLPLEFELDM
ncbi:MAG: hypothetical protein JW801_03900 [Bacteroidales bacterium]|nr:hypothetical protein [Bacteroidales bacterium]